MDNSFIALGLMSGTSLDGIDASIIKSDGKDNLEIIDNKYFNYPKEFKKKLSSFIKSINKKTDIDEKISAYKSLERELTLYHSKLSQNIIKALDGRKACLMSNHGQVAFGKSLSEAFELAEEIENICHQYINTIKLGQPKILSDEEMKRILDKTKNYKKN